MDSKENITLIGVSASVSQTSVWLSKEDFLGVDSPWTPMDQKSTDFRWVAARVRHGINVG
jgi:hypothetical protein